MKQQLLAYIFALSLSLATSAPDTSPLRWVGKVDICRRSFCHVERSAVDG